MSLMTGQFLLSDGSSMHHPPPAQTTQTASTAPGDVSGGGAHTSSHRRPLMDPTWRGGADTRTVPQQTHRPTHRLFTNPSLFFPHSPATSSRTIRKKAATTAFARKKKKKEKQLRVSQCLSRALRRNLVFFFSFPVGAPDEFFLFRFVVVREQRDDQG
ncbi:hypothetical protein BJV74DRAFT_108566 [Russula compacta]|nr:hypothetical protein BJV74DRAFT_108566 [Russula compacta]